MVTDLERHQIVLSLDKFKGSIERTIDIDGKKKKFICIPIEDNYIYAGKKGYTAYFRFVKSRANKWGYVYGIQQSLNKKDYAILKSINDYPSFIGGVLEKKSYSAKGKDVKSSDIMNILNK